MSALTRAVAADLKRHHAAFERADAVRTEPDGFRWIDQTRVPPELAHSYRRLCALAYATGAVPPSQPVTEETSS